MSDNVLMDFLVQEANACKNWVEHSERQSFDAFYSKVLASLREIGIATLDSKSIYELSLKKRLEELDRLERHHRVELEAAFLAVWLSKDMKSIRESYRHQSTIKVLQNM